MLKVPTAVEVVWPRVGYVPYPSGVDNELAIPMALEVVSSEDDGISVVAVNFGQIQAT